MPPVAETAIEPTPAPATEVEVVSLLELPLHRPELPEERRQQLEANLATARAGFEADPDREENIVWLGRRLAYLSRYQDAIEVYSTGLEKLPQSYKLLRHRGHRYITTRRFEDAIADLSRAAELMAGGPVEIEPDGVPNRLGVPLSTTQFNVWYHLGLAHFLQGDFESALDAYRECLGVSTNPDLLVATTDWMYMTLRRLGRDDEARALLEPITAELEIIENDAYHRRLLMYRGEVAPDDLLDLHSVDDPDHSVDDPDHSVDDPDQAVDDPDRALQIATQGYGVGNWYLVEGDRDRAFEIFERIVKSTSWAAFGYIAAECELARAR